MDFPVPKCMSTQHPDNVATPTFADEGVVRGEGEVLEAREVFSLGADEQLWDSEGKDVDRMVVSKLLAGHSDFFSKKKLGKDCFLTLRIPNPAIEQEMRKTLLEALESIPSGWDVARQFYQGDTVAPIHEVVLPFTTSAEDLNLIYSYYRRFVVGKANEPLFNNFRVSDWIGEFYPSKINVIPLIEDLDNMLKADTIVEEYLMDKDSPYQRVFLARSDPALNYGIVSAELMLKIALQRLSQLEGRLGIPLYCIVGVGSAPFRGHFTPLNLERAFNEYPSVHTFTVQSAFKYDYPRETVIEGINKILTHERQEHRPIDEARAKAIIQKYSAEYRQCLRKVAPLVNRISPLVPKRRDRRLHIGLFGYSRELSADQAGQESIILPRAINFCASLYSIGLPPELMGMSALDYNELSFLHEVYPSLKKDLSAALRFAHEDAVRKFLGEPYLAAASRYVEEVDQVHKGLAKAALASLDQRPREYTQRYLVEAARLRCFLG